MIRYHRTAEVPWGFLVSSKRKPRGFLTPSTVTFTERRKDWTHTREEIWWQPVGLNGSLGPTFRTKRRATEALLSHQDLQGGEFTGTVYPNPWPVRQGKRRGFWSRLFRALNRLFEPFENWE